MYLILYSLTILCLVVVFHYSLIAFGLALGIAVIGYVLLFRYMDRHKVPYFSWFTLVLSLAILAALLLVVHYLSLR